MLSTVNQPAVRPPASRLLRPYFDDWLGGPLARVFGSGIKDVAVMGDKYCDPGTKLSPHRLVHAAARSYFRFPDDAGPDSFATHLRLGLDIASTSWLRTVPAPTVAAPVQPVRQSPVGQP